LFAKTRQFLIKKRRLVHLLCRLYKQQTMLTEKDLERFNIDKFIAACLELDWIDMHIRCVNMGILAGSMYIPLEEEDYKHKEELRLAFSRFMNEFCFIIDKEHRAVIPPGMSDEDFEKVKPVIEKLVASGDLKKDWLSLYKKP